MKFSAAYSRAVLAAVLILGACADVPERSPDKVVSVSALYAGLTAKSEKPITQAWPERWWEIYDNEELNVLIAQALEGSPDIAQTRSRLEQAAATARRELADLLPSLDAGLTADTERGDGRSPTGFTLGGAAGYELDLWGKNRAGHRSALLAAEAAAEDVRAAAITLSASITEGWLRLMALREEEALLKQQVEINTLLLDLQHRRYAGGVVGALDVLQQKELLARARAQLPDIKSQQELVAHQLALLAGLNPSESLALSGDALPESPPLPETGIPAQLIERRPDIAAAWLRLRSADWAAGEARAERLPSFDISAGYTSAAAKFAQLTESWLLNLAVALAVPVIDGGERRAEEARRLALADERFQDYRQSVLAALAEVEDALSLNIHQEEKIAAVREQLEAARDSLEQAQISYAQGDQDYLAVLTSLLNVQNLERQLVQERRVLAVSRVTLYRALGYRTWTDHIVLARMDE